MTATAPACCAQWVKRRARAKSLNTQPCNNSEADHTLPSYTTAFPERLEATWEGEGGREETQGRREDRGNTEGLDEGGGGKKGVILCLKSKRLVYQTWSRL